MLCARHQRWPAVQNANADLTLSRLIGQALPSVRQGVRGVGVERLELLPYALRRCFADSGVGGGPDSAPVRDRWPPTAALLQTPFQTPSFAQPVLLLPLWHPPVFLHWGSGFLDLFHLRSNPAIPNFCLRLRTNRRTCQILYFCHQKAYELPAMQLLMHISKGNRSRLFWCRRRRRHGRV